MSISRVGQSRADDSDIPTPITPREISSVGQTRTHSNGLQSGADRPTLGQRPRKTPEEIGRATLECLAKQVAANKAAGAVSVADVRAVWAQHPDYTAKQVIKQLPLRSRTLSVRRVQEILKGFR